MVQSFLHQDPGVGGNAMVRSFEYYGPEFFASRPGSWRKCYGPEFFVSRPRSWKKCYGPEF